MEHDWSQESNEDYIYIKRKFLKKGEWILTENANKKKKKDTHSYSTNSKQ